MEEFSVRPNRPKTFARKPTIPQEATDVSIYDKGPRLLHVSGPVAPRLFKILHPNFRFTFSEVRIQGILPTSPFGHSTKFAPRNSHMAYKDTPFGGCA